MLVLPDDTERISSFLKKNTYLYLYLIGDLDERFLPYTKWYGKGFRSELSAVVCIYTGGTAPTLLAFDENTGRTEMEKLLKKIIPLQPERLEAHLSPGLEKLFIDYYTIISDHMHYKMALSDTDMPGRIPADVNGTEQPLQLSVSDIPALLELYENSYPGNWFEPEMLGLNLYYGIYKDNDRSKKLLCTAGTHVYSPEYRAAALGNITTLPEYRGRGYGASVTAALCRALLNQNIHIGLNVKQNNQAAIACYRKTGFSICAEYGEFIFERRNNKK